MRYTITVESRLKGHHRRICKAGSVAGRSCILVSHQETGFSSVCKPSMVSGCGCTFEMRIARNRLFYLPAVGTCLSRSLYASWPVICHFGARDRICVWTFRVDCLQLLSAHNGPIYGLASGHIGEILGLAGFRDHPMLPDGGLAIVLCSGQRLREVLG